MACNCKRAKAFEEKYGIPQEESVARKIIRRLYKVLFAVIAIVFAIVLTPCIMLMALYAMFFTNGRIVLPKFLNKYLKNNGE